MYILLFSRISRNALRLILQQTHSPPADVALSLFLIIVSTPFYALGPPRSYMHKIYTKLINIQSAKLNRVAMSEPAEATFNASSDLADNPTTPVDQNDEIETQTELAVVENVDQEGTQQGLENVHVFDFEKPPEQHVDPVIEDNIEAPNELSGLVAAATPNSNTNIKGANNQGFTNDSQEKPNNLAPSKSQLNSGGKSQEGDESDVCPANDERNIASPKSEQISKLSPEVGEDSEEDISQLYAEESSESSSETENLKKETAKMESAIETFQSPPLPPRSHIGSTQVFATPYKSSIVESNPSPAASQSPISPPLPPRQHTKRQHAVPPPFHEELRSGVFKRNLAMTTAPPAMPPLSPAVDRAKRLESAAEINLIANRLRQTSHHYQKEDEASREYLEKGQDMLKTSYSMFLESLPSAVTLGESLTEKTEDGKSAPHKAPKEPSLVDWEFWTQVVNDFPSVASDPEKLEEKVTDGIPAQIRGIIWQLVSNSKSKEFEDIYQTLLDTESPHEASIRRDLKRTKYLPEDKMECLFRILKVYSVYDPDVGYTQGMAFIATPLILNCNTEAEALGLLIRLMKFYGVRDLFLPDMPGLMMLLYQFDRLLEENSPQTYNHLTRQGVRSSMYATQWFLTFFAYKFPLGFVLRIFDIVFIEGIESILRFAVNLMLKNSEYLLVLNFDKLLDYLKNELFNYYLKESIEERSQNKEYEKEGKGNSESDTGSVLKKEFTSSSHLNSSKDINDDDYDIELFVHEAMHDVHVTPISLKRYASEYDEIHQIEQQKEAQYESIKIKNLQLQKEVRKLEHDYTLLNREHVEIANELIKNRLKIETLLDENSDQKLYILELKKQLDEEIRKQALPNPDAALPIDLRLDLDKTIKRNAEVMSENAKLQDKLSEQERIIFELKAANKAGVESPLSNIKPPLTNGWSGLKKVFK